MVRVITVITSYRDIHAVCVHRRGPDAQRPHSRIRLPRIAITRFVIDSRLESSGRGKCSDDRVEEEGPGGGPTVLENVGWEESTEVEHALLAFFSSPSLFPLLVDGRV